MAILKLKPACKDYLWGGNRLKKEFHKEFPGEVLAETWELSCHKDGASTIAEGADAGKTLPEYIAEQGKAVLGTNCDRFTEFPLLIKLIDARETLSIQVHPDNEYALEHEGQYGKREAWYIVEADEGAGIFYGVNRSVTGEEFRKHIENHTLLDIMHFQKVRPGEVYFIEAGTLHAIGGGVLIAEIQQNSNVTYRVFDFDRAGVDGRPRELHIEQARQVAKLTPVPKNYDFGTHLSECDYFTVDDFEIHGTIEKNADEKSFHSILVLDGEGTIRAGEEKRTFQKGDSLFVTAGTGTYEVCGNVKSLLTTVRK